MHRNLAMRDNSDVQEIRDGRITDMRIESAMLCIVEERWDEPQLDTLFTELVQEFIHENTPTLLVSQAGKNGHLAQGLLYLNLFNMDFELVHRNSPYWPGQFDFMVDADCAIRVRYPEDDERYTSWAPGRSPCAAALAAIMQACREISDERYNKDAEVKLN